LAREKVVCFLVRYDVENGELVSDCGEKTVAVWGYLFGAWDIGERGVENK
jgi:hypothetical protein